jgi:hypothetical protein
MVRPRNLPIYILGGLTLLAAFLFAATHQKSVHCIYSSPHGGYKVIVYRYPMLFSFPGGASDARGLVCLVNSDGREIRREPVQMVQLVESVKWSDTNVEIIFVFDWPLPIADSQKAP